MTATAEPAATTTRPFASSRAKLSAWVARGIAILRAVGPYAAIEILLPGGTLMAGLLWLYRWHRKRTATRVTVAAAA